jgi:hypothetical protein
MQKVAKSALVIKKSNKIKYSKNKTASLIHYFVLYLGLSATKCVGQ